MISFVSPKTGASLHKEGEFLKSDSGESFPIVRNIPRFVSSDNYAAAFGLEWKRHAKTQLDSFSGTRVTRTRFERCIGKDVSALKGLNVMEAGCGAGRFTELMVNAGANTHSFDLSVAVEANQDNIGDRPNYSISQASLLEPPFPKASFDYVFCLGVIQHTPSPEKSIESLWKMVKPGGNMVIDHYTLTFSFATKLSNVYRIFLRKMDPEKAKKVTDKMVDFFFPIHWAVRKFRPAQMLLSRVSPCLVYFNAFPELTKEQHKDWCRLDTFDHTTDYYKHLRSPRSIRKTLKSLGAVDIEVWRGGNGVEARCRKPLA